MHEDTKLAAGALRMVAKMEERIVALEAERERLRAALAEIGRGMPGWKAGERARAALEPAP